MKYQKMLELEIKGLYHSILLFDRIDILKHGGLFIKSNGITVFNAILDGYKLTVDRKIYSPETENTIVVFKLVKGEE